MSVRGKWTIAGWNAGGYFEDAKVGDIAGQPAIVGDAVTSLVALPA